MRGFGWVGMAITSVVATLYLAAFVIAPKSGTQLTTMLGISNAGAVIAYNVAYTANLVVCLAYFVAFSLSRRASILLFIVSTLTAIAMTVIPVGRSLLVDFRPGFYEHYVGETVTVISLVLLLSSMFALDK